MVGFPPAPQNPGPPTRIKNNLLHECLLPSSLHRVVVTHAANGAGPGSTSVPSRFSIPYFFLPSPDGLIAPQETRVKEDGKAKYEAMTFKEYSERMFLAARGEKGDE